MSNYCFVCGGQYDERFIDKPCPECGKQYKKSANVMIEVKPSEEFVASLKELAVPDFYHGKIWNKERIKKDNQDIIGDKSFERYIQQLDRIHNIFMEGRLPNKSGIIIAPPRMSKVTWAYSCMQQALKHNYSVAWLLDTVEVKRLLVLAGDNPRYKLYDKVNYDEYIMSDVCFITVTKTEYRYDSYSTILEVIDRRARKGLSTFIISRYDLKQLSRRDYDRHFSAIKDFNGHDNDQKYPVIVQYWNMSRKERKGAESNAKE